MDAVDSNYYSCSANNCTSDDSKETSTDDEATNSNGNTSDDEPGSPSEHHELSSCPIQRIFGLNRGARTLPRDEFRLPQLFLEEFATPVTALLTIILQRGAAFMAPLESDDIRVLTTVKESKESPYWCE